MVKMLSTRSHLLFLFFILVSMATANKHEGIIEKERSRRNPTHRRELEAQFLASLKVVTNFLPQKSFCKLLDHFLEERNISFVSFFQKFPFNNSKEKACRDVKVKYKKNAREEKSLREKDLVFLFTRLYNTLPLPFQCSILTMTTLKQVEKARQSRQEHANGKYRSTSQILNRLLMKDMSEFPRGETQRKVGNLVKKTEAKLARQHDIIPIARQCSKLIREQNAYTDTVKFIVQKTNKTQPKVIERRLLCILKRVMEYYTKEHGIKTDIDPYWTIRVDSIFHAVVTNTKILRTKYIFYTNVYLLQPNSGPRNANTVMSALYLYGKKKLKKYLNAHVRFVPFFQKQGKNAVRRNLKPQSIFPEYITPYFESLSRPQQCLIVQMLSAYTKKSKEDMVQYLLDNGRIEKAICVQAPDTTSQSKTSERTRLIDNTKTTVATNAYNLKQNMSYDNVTATATVTTKATTVEILMIVSLTFVLIAVVVFFVICGMFCHRRQKYKHNQTTYVSTYDKETSDLHAYYVIKENAKNCQHSIGDDINISRENINNDNTLSDTSSDRNTDSSILDGFDEFHPGVKQTIQSEQSPKKFLNDSLFFSSQTNVETFSKSLSDIPNTDNQLPNIDNDTPNMAIDTSDIDTLSLDTEITSVNGHQPLTEEEPISPESRV